ncbi:TrmO family methyltransferase domain-containing protein [Marinactinospora rubrisoli]|uniref:TrmO family methyltransferase n=1 Tax=Marinactinospora rubrisoli TaxID=2715399 RepID=A0ABW2KGM1_9ACTN
MVHNTAHGRVADAVRAAHLRFAGKRASAASSPLVIFSRRSATIRAYWGGTRCIIRLHPECPVETLQGLAEFSYLQIVCHFRAATSEGVHLGARHPRNNPVRPSTGTFVHRDHRRRPAQLAVSHPRLLRVDGHDLHVEDLDAIDGTPVIDIAPWSSEFGPRGEIREPAWPGQMLTDYWAQAPEPEWSGRTSTGSTAGASGACSPRADNGGPRAAERRACQHAAAAPRPPGM